MQRSPHQLTTNVKLLHKVAIISDSKVLLLKRDPESSSRPNCWDLPGGNSEWPEEGSQSGFDVHQADVAREIQEETGIQVNKEHFDESNLLYFHTYFDASNQIYTIICGWKLELSSAPSVTLSHEHAEHQWVSIADLEKYDFGGERGKFIKEIVYKATSN